MSIRLIPRDVPTAAVDFETQYDNKRLNLKLLGPWHYANHPEVEIHTVSVVTLGGSFVGRPWEFDWSLIEEMRWVSHNAAFDRTVFDAMNRKYDTRARRPREWQCTANMVAYLGSKRSLDAAAQELLEVDVSKDTRKQMMGKTYADMVSSGFAPQMEAYALRDSEVCLQLWEECRDRWPEIEQRASLLTMLQTERGLPLNQERLERGIELLQRRAWEAANRLPWRNDGSDAAVLSPIQLAKACRDRGIAPPKSTAEDNQACIEWEEAHPEISWVKDMRDYRKANLLLTKLQTMLARARDDGRLAYGVKYFGGHTGRWSGDQGLNVHGFGKEPMVIEECDHEGGILKAVKQGVISMADAADQGFLVDMRACVEVIDPGRTLFVFDKAQIEPRVLNWLAGDHDFLREVARGMSVYEVHARQVMGWKGGVLKDENPLLYAKAKAEVLGLGYGMGSAKYQVYALGYGVRLTPLESKKVVNLFRRRKPKIEGLWDAMHEGITQSLGEDFVVELPSWRSMTYRGVHNRKLTSKSTGKSRVQLCATIAGGRINALWGSLIVENLVQAVSRDVFLEDMLRIEDAGLPTILSVHDEVVGECDEGVDPREIEEIMSTSPDWAPDLPVACEGKLTKYYLK